MKENRIINMLVVGDASSTHLRRWASWYVARGHTVHIASDLGEPIDGASFHPLRKRGGISSFFARSKEVKKLAIALSPDIVNAHYAFGYGYFGAKAGVGKLVLNVIGSDVLLEPKRSFMAKKMVRWTIAKAALIHTVAKHLTKETISLGAKEEMMVTFPYTPDPEVFSEQRGVTDGQTVLSVRPLEKHYNVIQLIEAAPLILEKAPNTRILVGGRGSQLDMIKARIKELGIEGRIELLGYIKDLAKDLASADIYVSTSTTDGTSVALLEAMASGAFPVVTDIEANRPWVTDGATGSLVELGNAKALAEAVVGALDNDELRTKAAKINRQTIIDNSYDKWMELFEKRLLAII